MSNPAVKFQFDLVPKTCAKCGIAFAVPTDFHRRYEDGAAMRCPNPECAWGSFILTRNKLTVAKEEAEKLRRRLEWKESELRRTELRRRAALGQATKLKNRVRRGVCPFCNRSFADLRRHMDSKHGELP